MYFESRGQAGRMLADKLAEYRYENCAVVALSVGGVVVAEQIASQLHCVMMLLVSKDIDVPGEGVAFGSVAQTGAFTYNSSLSKGEIEGYNSEFHGYLDEQKREAFQEFNRLLGTHGTIDIDMLRGHVIIIVEDGLDDSLRIDATFDFFKPVRTQRLIVAAPVASVSAVDKVHVLADELHILDVRENYINTDHYYEQNTLPAPQETMNKISEIITNWR